jgi:hypothetical protein
LDWNKKKAAASIASGKTAAFLVYKNGLVSEARDSLPIPAPGDLAHQFLHHEDLSFDVTSLRV